MKALKHEAIRRGLAPQAIQGGLASFRTTGKLTKASKATRKKLGLPEVPDAGVDELQTVLDDKED